MEKAYWWIGLVGSIASIVSAGWAWIQANRAKQAASDAARFRGEIINRRELIENSHIYKETKSIQNRILALGPKCSTMSAKGIDCAELAESVLRYSSMLQEHTSNFPDATKVIIASFATNVKPLIDKLARAKRFDEKKNVGTEIYFLLEPLLAEIKIATDVKKEKLQ